MIDLNDLGWLSLLKLGVNFMVPSPVTSHPCPYQTAIGLWSAWCEELRDSAFSVSLILRLHLSVSIVGANDSREALSNAHGREDITVVHIAMSPMTLRGESCYCRFEGLRLMLRPPCPILFFLVSVRYCLPEDHMTTKLEISFSCCYARQCISGAFTCIQYPDNRIFVFVVTITIAVSIF